MNIKVNMTRGGAILKKNDSISPQTQELLNVMMEEPKLTMFQKKQLRDSIKEIRPLPTVCGPTSSCKKSQKQIAPVKVRNHSQFTSSKRKKEIIDLISEKEKVNNMYIPKTCKVITEEDKELLQNKMAYGKDFKQFKKTAKKTVAIEPSENVDEFNIVLQEIEERKNFLKEMEKLGKEKNYLLIIETEISQNCLFLNANDLSMLRYFFGALFLNQVNCLPILDSFKSKILNAGELFILYFDNKLDLSINYNNCSNIFDTNTIAKLGSQPICRVFSKNSIKLIPSQDAVLAFGDSLDFDNISISSDIPFLIENFTDAYQKPFIKINGPNSYCRCSTSINDNLKVNVDFSNLTGYAPLKNIKWHIYDNEFADGEDLFAVELEVFQGLSEITIQSNWFTASQDYYIFVYGENVFGNNGSALKRVKFSKDCLPYVEIHLNSMYSDDDSIALKATVTYPLCSNQTQIFYPDWFLIDIDLPPVIDIFSDLLYIPHTVLSTGIYEVFFRFIVHDNNNTERRDSINLGLNIESISSGVRIVGGDRTVGKFNVLKLSTEPLHLTSSGSYSWRCLFENKPCIQKSKNMVFPTYNYLEMNLQPSDLFPNSQFTIEVKYTSNGLISTSSVNIMVLSGNVPMIKIKAKKNKVSYSESVTFIADVENVHTSFNYSWSCLYKYDDTNQELNLETPTWLEVVNFVDGRVPSVIKRFPSYYFDYDRIVVCKFSFLYGNQLIYAYEEVEIVMPIKNANIIASPQSGLAYEDKFRFRVFGWHQSNVYLFRFGFYVKYNTDKESDKVYKSMWSAQNWIENVQFFIEKGNGPGNKLKIFCEIIDNQGFITTITTDIIIIPFIAENRVKISKKAFDFAYYLQTDQLQCAEYLLDIIPLANLSNLLGSDPQRIQTNLVLYLAKFRKQGFIALLVTKAMDVIYKFVYATKGIMNQDTLKNITSTLNYISVNILTVRQEIDAIKMAKQLIDISNILVNSSGNLKVVLSETPSIIKGFLNVAGSNYDNQQESFHGSFISGLFVLERFLLRASTSVLTLNNNLKNKYRKWQCQNEYPFNCTGILVVQAQYDYCQVWNVAQSMFDPTLCYYFAYMQEEHVLCRCKRLGKIVALYQEGAFPTTESAIIDPNLSYTFYFHMDFDPYCSTITRMKSVTNKFSYQLQQYIIARGLLVWPKLKLELRRSRLVVVNCLNGGFGISIINMTFKDRYGELRSWFIKQEIENLVVNQTFKIQMKQGGDIALFDVNQTTAKPTITIPPIEEIKTNWIPFIAVVLMFFFIFLVLAFWKYFHQTRLFAQMVYKDVNNYKPKRLSEVEKEKQANKKLKIERINIMHMEGFVAEEKSRSNNKIRPVNEATVMGGSFFFRDSPILDSEPRSSLDESDNENIFTSKIMLIKAASINALNDFNVNNSESECVEK
nr:uncharacterized protein LOC101236729 isoform X3 [Hydra vulgaris]